ncbi:MAG: CinA family protein [Proteobacteria bacterium]|nr:CinA family protein [Pseudomonadota bacterium]
MFFTSNLLSQAQEILRIAEEKKIKIAIAESCTGGLLSALFTEISGASKTFERGFVTYSNQAKIDLLGVKKKTLENFGAVSAQTAEEMAKGALENSQADIAIAITGVAGPEEKSGLVHIAVASHTRPTVNRKFHFSGDRHEIRKASMIAALQLLDLKE